MNALNDTVMALSFEVDVCDEAEQDEQVIQARKNRSLMFHLLYACYAHDYQTSLASIIDNLNRGFDCDIDPSGSVAQTIAAVVAQRHELDAALVPLLDKWRLDRIGICTHLILRLALWELLHTDTDPKIVINEAIELAKCFAEKDAYRFINGVLDQAIKRLPMGTAA